LIVDQKLDKILNTNFVAKSVDEVYEDTLMIQAGEAHNNLEELIGSRYQNPEVSRKPPSYFDRLITEGEYTQ